MTSMQSASAASSRRGTIAKRTFLAAGMLAAMLATLAADAQSNLKIGVVNFGRLLEEAPQSAAVQEKLKDEFASRQRDIVAMRQKLQGQQDTFTRDAPVMGEAERVSLEREIRDGQRDLQRAENQYVEDVNLRRNEEVNRLNRELVQQVQAYASAQKYDLIVADAVYFSNAVDITAAVLDNLKKSTPAPRAGGAQRGQ